jgi:triosephosphate isomerase
MLTELGVSYVLVGHSERRMHLWEDDRMVNSKIRAALRHRLQPVLCVGEAEDIRVAGAAKSRVRDQVALALEGVKPDSGANLIVAYEPIWAIGTGRAASPADAVEMHTVIRAELHRQLGDLADAVRILYGGSVTPENIDAFMARPEIDGALVGGASLKPDEFLRIIGFLSLEA